MKLAPGTKLGPYQIITALGAGGMGEVYRARDTALNRDVAIKILPTAFSSDPDRLRRFMQEAQAAAALNHPNILAVFQLGTYEGAPYLVSELLEGETLREQIKRGALSVRKAGESGVQIARGLAAAHEKGIVHRDLKPENLFITKDGRIKILDFGLAKLVQAADASEATRETLVTESGMVLGTIGYMSPEQVRGQAADHRTDIFAFGAVLYEMLTGNRAFQRQTSADTMSAILNEDPQGISQIVPSIPTAVQRVVHRCLEKSPEQRFQSASDLAFALEALSAAQESPLGLERVGRPTGTARSWWWTAGAVAIVLVIGFLVWLRTPPQLPQVRNVAQLTDDGEPKGGLTWGSLVSDGTRVYFNEGQTNNWRIAEVSVSGGRTAPVTTRVPETVIAGITPDFSALLTFGGRAQNTPLWLAPIPAGDPRRVGDLTAMSAEFFPDGQRIVYGNGSELYTATRDGSNARKLADLPGAVGAPSVSPDGKHIRFTVFGSNWSASLWEIEADGSGKRELLKDWRDSPFECCGKWTADGRYFVFAREHEGRYDLWAVSEASHLLFRSMEKPVQLTNGPLSYLQPFPSRDGKALFAIGSKPRGELIRYDSERREFVPFLAGISATDVMPSRDGKWVVYLSYPERTLWRSRADGSDRLQLVYPPLLGETPHISPDGTRVAFGGFDRTQPLSIYIVSMLGGQLQKIIQDASSPAWSPDGNYLVFESAEIHTVDLRTGANRIVPDSRGKEGPWWPTQDSLVASSTEGLVMFDFRTQKWMTLATGNFTNWFPTWDGRYVYCEQPDASGPKVYRIRLADRHMELVADLSGLRRVESEVGTWLGVAPDGSVLLTRDVGTQEVYALNVSWP